MPAKKSAKKIMMETPHDPLHYYRSMAVLMVDFLAASNGVSIEEYFEAYNAGKHKKPGHEVVSFDLLMRYSDVQPRVKEALQILRECGEPVLDKVLRMGMVEEQFFDV